MEYIKRHPVLSYHLIKTGCRKGLIRYLEVICRKIPNIDNAHVLDIGCGTGVPTLCLADKFSGKITAIDTDKESLDYFHIVIIDKNYQTKIKIINASFLDFKFDPDSFDVILAEGFLNVVGFETGFMRAIKFLKNGGYFIIHDEFKDHDKKCDFIQNNHCKIIDILYLDESIWWNDYYRQLETEMKKIKDFKLKILFSNDISEIENYKADPSVFRSIYYLVLKL